jgi:glyoxylase-like metal-dependent hydrolase (beta-lactamase superfamily II)
VAPIEERSFTMTQPIQRLAHLQTGTVDLHVQHVEGSPWNALLWIFFGRERIEGLPLSVFVIEHRDALILIDAGISPRAVTDPEFWPDPVTRVIMNNIFHFHVEPEDALGRQLSRAGYAPEDVDKAIITHLHFDHVGGIADIPGAELITSREAWEHMLGPHPEREGVLRRDIEIPGAKWRQIEYGPIEDATLQPFTHGHDLMGDGSIVLLPTPGHLDGSSSIFLRVDPPILFAADLCYRTDLLIKEQFPGTGEHELLAESWARVHELKARLPDLLIVPSHEEAAVARLLAHPLATGGR